MYKLYKTKIWKNNKINFNQEKKIVIGSSTW